MLLRKKKNYEFLTIRNVNILYLEFLMNVIEFKKHKVKEQAEFQQ